MRQTHKPSTVTLAAHARRGLMTTVYSNATCGVMNGCTQPWKLSAVESSSLMQQPNSMASTLYDHIKGKSTQRYGCAPTVLTAEEMEIVTGASNPVLLNSSGPPAQTALLPTSKHPSAPITTPVHHQSSSTVVYSLYATHSSV